MPSSHLASSWFSVVTSDLMFLSLLRKQAVIEDCACMEPRFSHWEVKLGVILPFLGTQLWSF